MTGLDYLCQRLTVLSQAVFVPSDGHLMFLDAICLMNRMEKMQTRIVRRIRLQRNFWKLHGDLYENPKKIEELEKQHRQLTGAKNRLGQKMDSLDITDRFYEKKYQDMDTRLYRLYDEIEGVKNSISEVKNRLLNIKQKKLSEDNVYQFLLYFDKLYNKFRCISMVQKQKN